MAEHRRIDEWLSILLLAAMTIVAFAQVLCRFVLNLPLDWSEELARYLLIMLVYLSGVITVREESMLRVEIIDLILKGRARKVLSIVVQIVSCIFMLFVAYQNTFTVRNAMSVKQTSPAIGIPMALLYGCECLLFLLMAIMFAFVSVKKIRSLVSEEKSAGKGR